MPHLPELAHRPFPMLRSLYEECGHDAVADPLVRLLRIVAPQWAFHTCQACVGLTTFSTGWRGLYWSCAHCEKTGSVDDESHQRLASALDPMCPCCNEPLTNRKWRAGNFLLCVGCGHRVRWRKVAAELWERGG